MYGPEMNVANFLILGRGKTGSMVAAAARERGHGVQVLGSADNPGGRALTRELLGAVDGAIDFTTPAAVVDNLRALLPLGARVVVGTTGWYAALPAMQGLAQEHGASLLHGTNFSLGVQAFFRAARELAEALPGFALQIEETHHITKRDAPSGTALTLQRMVEEAARASAPVISHREGDAAGLHVLTLRSPDETLTLGHEAWSRRAFALGAVRAAEWLLAQTAPGVWDFAAIAPRLRDGGSTGESGHR